MCDASFHPSQTLGLQGTFQNATLINQKLKNECKACKILWEKSSHKINAFSLLIIAVISLKHSCPSLLITAVLAVKYQSNSIWRHKPGILCLHLWEKVKLCWVNTFVMIDSDFWSFDQKDPLQCSRFCMLQHCQLIYFLFKLIHRRFLLTSDFVSEHQIFTY